MKNINLYKITSCFTFLFWLSSCTSVIEDPLPQSQISASKAIQSAAGARAALYGAYDALQSGATANLIDNYNSLTYLLFPDLQGGNLRWTGTFTDWGQASTRTILTDNASVTGCWRQIYYAVNSTNNIIKQVPLISDPAFTDQSAILGEAYFLRAYHYFNLLRYWGGVPLVTEPTVDIDGSSFPARATLQDTYTQIFSDLGKAISLLPKTSNVARANVNAAYALKSRIHLYRQEWQSSIDAAALVPTSYKLMTTFGDVWAIQNTAEAIWEINFNTTDKNNLAFYLFSSTRGGRNEVRPTPALQSAYSANDVRIIKTTDFNKQIKYYRVSTGDDHVIPFRYAELILNQAEAYNELGQTATAFNLINQIRTRAGIGNAAISLQTDQAGLRTEIFNQRRLELALEGHYFFDLVRTGRAATVLANWNNNQALWPIPFREIQANSTLVQNPGY